MTVVKRERSHTPENALVIHSSSTPETASAVDDSSDIKPDITPPSKKKASSPRKPGTTPKAQASSKADGSPGAKQSQKAWTPEEEAVFIAVFDRMVKDHLWTYAKEEEAIAHRGSTGVRAHWTAMAEAPDLIVPAGG